MNRRHSGGDYMEDYLTCYVNGSSSQSEQVQTVDTAQALTPDDGLGCHAVLFLLCATELVQ